ncbi:phosphopantetheine-binding protein [Kangiella sediminilitoris]|uniref:Acyl carrier protein, putative n=1 Tax=Kangiella sediminilitoris TaxID=1144748 RepID=A0A1B3BDY5_9GAMM|nr:phosphopantetheine-binding protein [Kangiella sediminilitoris]AOE50973.1 Acyl carrier protein, putative [Kangiella sediminilitoris]
MRAIENEIKGVIIEALDLEDMSIDDIDTEEPLFGDGLGLDSIDALELGLALKKKFDIKLDSDSEESKKHFYSVQTLADFIEEQKGAE